MSLPLYELPAKDAYTTMERLTEDAARKAAASLGFPYFIGLSDGISLAAVVRHPQNPLKSLCGVYLQIRKSGGFYIGQTRNLLQRQYDYTASGIEIDWLAFQPVPLKRLTQAEHEKIQRAIHAGFPLVNRQHAAWSVPRHPDETFDHLFPPEDQDAFIAQGQHHGPTRAERLQAVESAAPPAHRDGWEWFSGLNKAAEMLRAAGAVIHAAIPEPESFLNLYWMLAFGRPTEKNSRLQLLSVYCGMRTIFECKATHRCPDAVFCTLELAGFIAAAKDARGVIMPKRHQWASWTVTGTSRPQPAQADFSPIKGWEYSCAEKRAADLDREVTLAARSAPYLVTCALEQLPLLLADPELIRALQVQAIASMRKQPLMNLDAANSIGAYAALRAV